MLLSPVTTILPKLRGSPMGNGDAVKTSLAARAADQDLLLRWNRAGFCQWRWRGISVFRLPAAGAAITMLRGWRVSAMENGECSPGSQPRQLGMRGEPMFY